MSEYIYYSSSGEPLANIDGKLSLAREQIMRCCDCRFSIYDGERCTFWKRTEKVNDYQYMDVAAKVEPDGFCAWGERKC